MINFASDPSARKTSRALIHVRSNEPFLIRLANHDSGDVTEGENRSPLDDWAGLGVGFRTRKECSVANFIF